MEVANSRVTLNKHGSDVPVNNITPAEAIVLHTLHGPMNGGRTFGDDFSKITVVGVAKVDTGKTRTVVVKALVPQQVIKGKQLTAATPKQVIPGDVIEAAVPEKVTPAKPASSEPGKPDYIPAQAEIRIPARPERRAPGYEVPALAATFEPDVIVPAIPEVTREDPILADRTPVQELARLRSKYGQAKNNKGELIIDKIWSDRMNPKMPEKFKDINWQEIGGLAASPELQATGINYVTGNLPVTGS